MARLGIDTGGPQPRRRLVLKHPRDQGAVVIHDPQAVAHHGLDGTAHGDKAGCWGVRRRVGKNGADAECVAPPSDQTQVVQDVTARGAWQRFLLPRGDATGPLKLLKFDRATAEYRFHTLLSGVNIFNDCRYPLDCFLPLALSVFFAFLPPALGAL